MPGISSTRAYETPLPLGTAAKMFELKIVVLYDNNPLDPRLKMNWGFSCLIQGYKKTILFDTGGDSTILLNNMAQLGIEPAAVEVVIFSHIHGDHTGGAGGFLKENSKVVVYLPTSFSQTFKDAVKFTGARIKDVAAPQKIFTGVYTTGELGTWIKEQSLVLTTGKGLVVITGCAHPGLTIIVRKAKEITGEERVYLVMGGFHLAGESDFRIDAIANELRQLSVEKVAPCHCSGEKTRKLFKQKYGADYIDSGVGKEIYLQKDIACE